MLSPFSKAMVDEHYTVLVKVPTRHEPLELLSLNGVPSTNIIGLAQDLEPAAWKEFLNALLPQVMDMTDGPLAEEVVAVVKTSFGEEEQVRLPCKPDAREAKLAALKAHFGSILSLGALNGLSIEEMSAVFRVVFGAATAQSMEEPTGMMDQMGEAMGQAMNMAGAQCKQQ